jgi:hypothetical protein
MILVVEMTDNKKIFKYFDDSYKDIIFLWHFEADEYHYNI